MKCCWLNFFHAIAQQMIHLSFKRNSHFYWSLPPTLSTRNRWKNYTSTSMCVRFVRCLPQIVWQKEEDWLKSAVVFVRKTSNDVSCDFYPDAVTVCGSGHFTWIESEMLMYFLEILISICWLSIIREYVGTDLLLQLYDHAFFTKNLSEYQVFIPYHHRIRDSNVIVFFLLIEFFVSIASNINLPNEATGLAHSNLQFKLIL